MAGRLVAAVGPDPLQAEADGDQLPEVPASEALVADEDQPGLQRAHAAGVRQQLGGHLAFPDLRAGQAPGHGERQRRRRRVPTDQFQPWPPAPAARSPLRSTTAASVPRDPSVLPADVGRTDFCIDVSLQAYKDSGSGAAPVGGNARITKFSWDTAAGPVGRRLSQLSCADANCTVGFNGDYFGLAVSSGNIYALFVSAHYRPDVTADGGGPVYYQQQVLATVPRSDFGTGF